MEMTVSAAPPYLRGSVVAMWELRGRLSGWYTGLPKPYAELIVSLSGTHRWRSSEGAAPLTFERGWLTPVQAGPRFAETLGELHLVGARLHPLAAARLSGAAGALGSAHPIPLDLLFGSEGERLRQSLKDAGGPIGRRQTFSAWLNRRLFDHDAAWLPNIGNLHRIGWRVDALAGELALSPRGLHKRFVQELGIGPKLWLQLGRFDAVLRHRPARGSLADIAVQFGYTDQAHMTAEFRRFAGVSPGAYIDARVNGSTPDDAPHLVPA